MKNPLTEKDIAMDKTAWTYVPACAGLHLSSSGDKPKLDSIHDSHNHQESGLANNSFDASAGIISIERKLSPATT